MQLFNRKTTVSLATALGLALGAAQAKAEEFVNILTGGTSGVYYPLGVAMEKIYSSIADVRPSVQATKASIENINLINSGRGEVAFTLGDSLRDAYEGMKPLASTRNSPISALWQQSIRIMFRSLPQESGIKTLADLKGKRLSVGAPKSGTELNARTILEAAGLSYDDLSKIEYLPLRNLSSL